MLWQWICDLLYPPKCIFCQRLLTRSETDLCQHCRQNLPYLTGKQPRAPYSRRCIGLFSYGDDVREAILRYKFAGRSHYAEGFGRMLAMKISLELADEFDCITYVPISRKRHSERGYDQAQLLAKAVARELHCECGTYLQKIRNVPAQSGIAEEERRRANVLGVYRACDAEKLRGRRILLIDDVMTTGATLSECCRTLLDAGAQEIVCAVVAMAQRNKHDSR